jgi:hypothetical protein
MHGYKCTVLAHSQDALRELLMVPGLRKKLKQSRREILLMERDWLNLEGQFCF